ncbi:long-chain-fatty-acid--CoA ligase [Phenylobacterium sp.]|uniref:long-chain-fatty-acid--CoA ligase n=1 Tax=Phenylobacterium sp. TaxID=1871053 RepID=UPI0025DB4D6F|nr:long-chain-fatty-acid--CoA ligase [Phenylobacterium sp.]MBX3483111.1 long-chain-fatty-acid--CoA ligase [Phenylobacterium sp.]MCW5761014.1 long-chain-fatty-acid--CoA ligase [Phenylobacterium sp.]
MNDDPIKLLIDIARVHGRDRGDRVAVHFEGRDLTYAELDRRSDRVAGMLQKLGVKPGDRVAWLGRPSEAWYEIFFGVAKARACLAPINSRLAVPEIAFILQDSGADVFFVTPEFYSAAEAVLSQVDREILAIGVGGPAPAFMSYADLRDAAPAPVLDEPAADDDVLQLYTSGTTGLPKGVRLSNANYTAFLGLRHLVEGFSYEADDTVLILMPMFHVAGTNISFSGMAAGGRVVLQAEFAPQNVLTAFGAERVNHVFLAPVMINALLQTPGVGNADFSSLKTVSYGASPISEAVLARATEVFGCGFIQFYGMTETTGAGTTLAPADHRGELLRSCGRPWATLETRIADEDGNTLPAGEIGEIEIRGPIVMAGYWNRPEATAETIRPDGWLRTGDAGFMDEDGFFFVHDRVKDMIVSGGENVYPAEVENAILGCPGVADAAVIGVPDDRWGEAVKAIVVPVAGAAPAPEDVIAWARQRIAGYKAPKSVDFIDALPRNPSGKVLRRELRKPYWEGRDRKVG